MPSTSCITLITDFGLSDGYVGAMKGVILSTFPQACIVDISHAIPPQDLHFAAWALYTAYGTFPEHTIHCVVVDPGVGSQRRALAVKAGSYGFVAPDNGVLSYVLGQEPLHMAVELADPRFYRHPVSNTFHGRDIFAPVAAHLARGLPLAELGRPIDEPLTWALSQPERTPEGGLVAHVIHVDRFGNCVTDLCLSEEEDGLIVADQLGEGNDPVRVSRQQVSLRVGTVRLSQVSRTYADGSAGEPLALVGSSGHLEIALVDGSAAEVLSLGAGDSVVVDLRV